MNFDRSSCLFCKIYDGEAQADEIYKDEDYMVFKDIKPAATHHYLVIPRIHIPTARDLTKENIDHPSILNHLVEIGKSVLEERGGDGKTARFGFHWPPFCSVRHLHLHVIDPPSEMNFLSNWIFRPNSYWFVSPEYIQNNILQDQ